jgi:hypothetical protein
MGYSGARGTLIYEKIFFFFYYLLDLKGSPAFLGFFIRNNYVTKEKTTMSNNFTE